VQRISRTAEGIFRVTSSGGVWQARVVVVAIGILGRPKKPSYLIPKEVQSRVRYDVTSEEMVGLQILVVGGGDTATEYCQFLVEKANQVELSYRGGELARPNPINCESIRALVERGSLRLWLASNVCSVEAAGQRILVHFAEQGIGPLEVDRIVYALGGTTPENFLRAAGIHFYGKSPKLGEGFSTSVPALYLAGDLTAGRMGGSIIQAFNSAAAAMRRICAEHGICRI
jgi:thioredoxin reductase (NADPH)